jgi:hypothetical protein
MGYERQVNNRIQVIFISDKICNLLYISNFVEK